MKKSIYYIILMCVIIFLAFGIFFHTKMGTYVCRHIKNYTSGYIISRHLNPDMPGIADVYDAEDFRAGALAACNEIQKYYGEDLCTRAGYWGVVGPRVTPEQSDYKLNAIGL